VKKKRVRYLVGAAGLAPAALGVAYPATAQASTGCTGHVEFYLPEQVSIHSKALVKGHGWYTSETNGKVCIGTVVVSVYTTVAGYDWPKVIFSDTSGHIYYSNGYKVKESKVGTWVHRSFGIHSSRYPWVNVEGRSGYVYSRWTECGWITKKVCQTVPA
jgi:hypothetical protein